MREDRSDVEAPLALDVHEEGVWALNQALELVLVLHDRRGRVQQINIRVEHHAAAAGGGAVWDGREKKRKNGGKEIKVRTTMTMTTTRNRSAPKGTGRGVGGGAGGGGERGRERGLVASREGFRSQPTLPSFDPTPSVLAPSPRRAATASPEPRPLHLLNASATMLTFLSRPLSCVWGLPLFRLRHRVALALFFM